MAAELQQGPLALGVRVTGEEAKKQVARVLREHGGRYLHYYDRWTIERMLA